MTKPRGKKFESEVSRMLRAHPAVAYVHHSPDLRGERFTLKNPIDFLCYLQGGKGLSIECKATRAKSLPFWRFASKRERFNGDEYGNQWRALEQCSRGGVETFVLVNHYGWSGRNGQRGKAWAVPFGALAEYRESASRKSWPLSFLSSFEELGKVREAWEWGIDQPNT
jgi:hypothetical protein